MDPNYDEDLKPALQLENRSELLEERIHQLLSSGRAYSQ